MTSSGDIGILTTDRNLVVQSWDDWLAAATSITAAAARGRGLQQLAPHVEDRLLLGRIEETLATGAVQVLSPALHRAFLPCPPRFTTTHFTEMQQRVTIGPLLDAGRIAGLLITVQDVTPQLETERQLAADLASDDPETRRAAAKSIAAARRIESLEHFTPVLGSDDWRVRGYAVRGLAAAADRDLLKALLSTLQREHRHFSTLSSALKLLAMSDVDVTEPLAELLQGPDPDLRIQAALALGEQHQAAAVPPLLQALEDPDANVRFHAIEALGRLRAESAIDPLLAIVESRDFFLAFAALEALALIRDSRAAPRLVPLLADAELREAAADALSQLGDEHVVTPLVAALNDAPAAAPAVAQALATIASRLTIRGQNDLDVAEAVRAALLPTGRGHLLAAAEGHSTDIQTAVAQVLGWIPGPDVVAALVRLAATPARSAAVAALARHREAAVDAFVALIATDDPDLRSTAIAALGRLGSHRATGTLIEQLDQDSSTVIAASGALARIGDAAAFEPLLALVGHRDPAVRQAVIGALNSIGHPDMPMRVAGLLQDSDPLVRESGIRIAGYFGYPGLLPLVTAALADPVESVRTAALEHLPFFDGEAALPCLQTALERETPGARAAAARALARIDEPGALVLLVRALGDPDNWVRYFAARALGERAATAELLPLMSLAEQDASVPVRIAAIDAIGARGGDAAAVPLLRCAAAPEADIAAAALRALGRIGGPDALHALRTHARADDRERRCAAIDGLGLSGTAEAAAQLEWIAAAETDPSAADRALRALAAIAASGASGVDAAVDALLALAVVPERRDASAAVLTQLPVEAMPRVARGLSTTDPAVRRRTVEVLARFRRPEATRHLAAAFDDPDAGVRETAVVAMLRLGTALYDDRLEQLREHDASKAVRKAAAAALAARRSAS